MKYLNMMVVEVASEVSKELPNTFGLTFDGWTCSNNTHYVGIFARYRNSEGHLKKPLLAICPLLDETHLTAVSYGQLLDSTVRHYGKSIENIAYICGDNTTTNCKLAREVLHIPIIGCASHRLNLAVKSYLTTIHEAIVTKVHDLMVRCRTIKNLAHLRNEMEGDFLKPILDNDTRWSSTFNMLRRYLQMADSIRAVANVGNDRNVLDLIPTAAEEADIKLLLRELSEIDEITVKLQADDMNMSLTRSYFDQLMGRPRYGSFMSKYLARDAKIIESPDFENAIVKVMRGEEASLTEAEKASIHPFLKPISTNLAEEESVSLAEVAEREEKRRRLDRTTSKYCDLSFINPTSNDPERLFSYAKLTNSDLRMSMTPKNFEARVFLKYNREYWNLNAVRNMFLKQGDDELIE
jgi:hypothetical protein